MSCLESVSFSFKFNDGIHGMVYPSRGIRQGCPLSPYLFILCAEALSNLLSMAVLTNQFHGLSISRGGPILSHLLFADDCLLFARATTSECSTLTGILSSYERASGQKVNMMKSEICFSKNVNVQRRGEITSLLAVREVDRHSKYLGLPTVVGKSKKTVFACIRIEFGRRFMDGRRNCYHKQDVRR